MKNKVKIILIDKGWILEKFANELADRIDYISIGKRPSSNCINYYINHGCFRQKSSGTDIAFFTHMEEKIPRLKNRFFEVAAKADHCISMSKKYQEIIRESGVNNVTYIPLGVDLEKYKPKLIIGYIGRLYNYTDRKGEILLKKIKMLDYVDFRTTEGKLPEQKMPDFYRNLDYVLIPSSVEGGPMPLLEGLACGKSIIAPKDVGMVSQFKNGIIHYKKSNFSSLKIILERLYNEKLKIRNGVKLFTWDNCAQKHDQIFKKFFK